MRIVIVAAVLAASGCGFGGETGSFASIPCEDSVWARLEKAAFNQAFDLPVGFAHLPDGTSVIACQRGMFYRADLCDPSRPVSVFLDFRATMEGTFYFEEGVHGIAFHPGFESNGRMFLSYTQNGPRRTVVSEMLVGAENDFTPLPETERVIFELEQPLADHWGGQILFGPDGFFYLGLGDGGLRDDPYRMAQNLWSLHGKILRLDVDRQEGKRAYAIPPDNPFVGLQLMREEIFASGIRNPWGLAFDPATGRLWCADVGQDFWEEVNFIEKGGNYGWSDRDGPGPLAAHPEALLRDAKPIDPVFAYSRVHGGGICIIGGYIYRGKLFPELSGSYLYGDWGYGLIEAAHLDREQTEATRRETLYRRGPDSGPFNPTFVGPDRDGEPVILSQDGAVWVVARK